MHFAADRKSIETEREGDRVAEREAWKLTNIFSCWQQFNIIAVLFSARTQRMQQTQNMQGASVAKGLIE